MAARAASLPSLSATANYIEFVKKNIELILILVVFVSVVPIIFASSVLLLPALL